MVVQHSQFVSNYAVEGGVFMATFESTIALHNCTIQSNFALRGGVALLINEASLQMTECTVISNMAIEASVAYVVDAKQIPVTIQNSTFVSNSMISEQVLHTEIVRCDTLCFLSEEYRRFVLINLSTMQVFPSEGATFTLIKSEMTISKGTKIQNSSNFLRSYFSSIVLDQMTFSGIISSSFILRVVQENLLTIKDTTFANC